MRYQLQTAIVALAIIVAAGSPALADDRKPSGEELSRIEAVLRQAGFTSWEDIEYDDGHWEVDDARAGDGRKYDLRLDGTEMQIVSRDEDD
jgi:hypothetical protein